MLVRLLVFIFKIVPKVAIKLCIALSHIMIDRVYTTFKDVFHAQQICGNLGYTIKTLRERIGIAASILINQKKTAVAVALN